MITLCLMSSKLSITTYYSLHVYLNRSRSGLVVKENVKSYCFHKLKYVGYGPVSDTFPYILNPFSNVSKPFTTTTATTTIDAISHD